MPYKDPEKRKAAKARHRASKKAKAAEGLPKGSAGALSGSSIVVYHSPEMSTLRVRTASDILAMLEGQAAAVLTDPDIDTCNRARTIGYLAGVMLRAVETADLTKRLEAIEEAIANRDGDDVVPVERYGT